MEVTRVSAGDASEELFARLGQPEGAAVMGIVPAVYDRVMRGVEEAGVREWRRDLLGGVGGDILEIGSGT